MQNSERDLDKPLTSYGIHCLAFGLERSIRCTVVESHLELDQSKQSRQSIGDHLTHSLLGTDWMRAHTLRNPRLRGRSSEIAKDGAALQLTFVHFLDGLLGLCLIFL